MLKDLEKTINSTRDAGFTLLEYCAGAAVIVGVIWLSLSTLGNNLDDLLKAIGNWATTRATEINEKS